MILLREILLLINFESFDQPTGMSYANTTYVYLWTKLNEASMYDKLVFLRIHCKIEWRILSQSRGSRLLEMAKR